MFNDRYRDLSTHTHSHTEATSRDTRAAVDLLLMQTKLIGKHERQWRVPFLSRVVSFVCVWTCRDGRPFLSTSCRRPRCRRRRRRRTKGVRRCRHRRVTRDFPAVRSCCAYSLVVVLSLFLFVVPPCSSSPLSRLRRAFQPAPTVGRR